jgi:SAM-dependent methyltransferase
MSPEPPAARRARGGFYTPEPLARLLAEAALRPLAGTRRRLRILDPACGDGAFLRAARNCRRGVELLGVDRDVEACNAARAHGLSVQRADALLEPLPAGFDVVLANPPYLSVKRAPFPPDYARALVARYGTAQGQFDACALFVERALALLRPGGRYALILPRPVLGNEEHEPLRRLLFEGAPPEEIVDLGLAFAGAAVETVGLVGTRGAGSKPIRLLDPAGATRGTLSLDEWARQPSLRLPLRVRPGELSLRARLERSCRPLGDAISILQRGIERGQSDPALRPRPGRASQPVLRGRDVGPFRCAPPARYLDPAALPRRHLKNLRLYDTPAKVLVRRVADRLMAAVDRSRALALNTLYCLHPAPGIDPDALCALLNSSAATFWWRSAFGADDRLFPYVRAEQLRALPLPSGPLDGLAPLGRRAAEGTDVRPDLDREVAALYGLSRSERALLARP